MHGKQIVIISNHSKNRSQLKSIANPFLKSIMPNHVLHLHHSIQSRRTQHHYQKLSDMPPQVTFLHHHRIIIPRNDKENGDSTSRNRTQPTASKMNPHYTKRRKAFHDIKTARSRHTHTSRFHIARNNA